jgi:hypothetical protein
MKKEEVFKIELNYIKDDKIRRSCATMINLLPDYFFHVEASSTGKYHPSYALSDGGLVRHTKSAVRAAQELFGIYKFDDETKDLIIMSLILHDGLKKNLVEERYTRFDHPLLAGNFIKENKDKLFLSDLQIEKVVNNIASHMGRWHTNEYNPGIVLPLPKTVEEKFVHMCDYLASRKVINVNFNGNDIIE